jgi:hypothetical protein
MEIAMRTIRGIAILTVGAMLFLINPPAQACSGRRCSGGCFTSQSRWTTVRVYRPAYTWCYIPSDPPAGARAGASAPAATANASPGDAVILKAIADSEKRVTAKIQQVDGKIESLQKRVEALEKKAGISPKTDARGAQTPDEELAAITSMLDERPAPPEEAKTAERGGVQSLDDEVAAIRALLDERLAAR